MKIETKFNNNTIDIEVNGEHWKTISRGLFFRIRYNILKTKDLEKFPAAEQQYAKDKALKLLSLQNQLSTLLSQKLKRYNLSDSAIKYAIDECIRLNLLDDDLWIESFVQCQIRKKNGPNLIRQKLKAKGINDDQIEKFMPKQNHDESIKKLLESRYAKYDLSNYSERQKVIAALQRKGFDIASILHAID